MDESFQDSTNKEEINTNKRKKNQLESSLDSSNSSPRLDFSKKTKMSDVLSYDAPIIIFKSSSQTFANPKEIKKEIDSNNLSSHVKEVKINRYGHLLIFPQSKTSAENIMRCQAIFNSAKKKDLSKEKKWIIVIKGLTYEMADNNMEELEEQGITEIIEIKNKDHQNNSPMKIVKAEVKDKDTRDDLLFYGVKLGYMMYKTEANRAPPMQCFKCKEFGHIAADCNNNERCEKCSRDKHQGECESEITCINCKQSHNAYNRRCSVYQNAKEITVKSTHRSTTASNYSSRTYSQVAKAPNSQDSKLDQIIALCKENKTGIEEIKDLNKQLENRVDNLEKTTDLLKTQLPFYINRVVSANNQDIASFVVDLLTEYKNIANINLLKGVAEQLTRKHKLDDAKYQPNYESEEP